MSISVITSPRVITIEVTSENNIIVDITTTSVTLGG